MPQYPLDFRQLCPTFQHPPGQTVAKHMRGDIFQPPRQVYERLAACDVSLTLYLSAQVLCGASPKLSHRSLRHPLRDSYPGGLPFRRHRNSDQKPFSLLVTTKSRQSLWAAHTLKIAAQQTRSIKMQRNTTRFACLAGKYPTKWVNLARKCGTLPSILDKTAFHQVHLLSNL